MVYNITQKEKVKMAQWRLPLLEHVHWLQSVEVHACMQYNITHHVLENWSLHYRSSVHALKPLIFEQAKKKHFKLCVSFGRHGRVLEPKSIFLPFGV